MGLNINSKIGEWVAENIRYAHIFDQYKLDFCCGGDKSLGEVCKEMGIDVNRILLKLNEVAPSTNSINLNEMNLTDLVGYIEREFHDEIRNQIPKIQMYLDKVIQAHGLHHKELFQIKELIDEGFQELIHHLEKEEQVLFPMVKELSKDNTNQMILNVISVMECEHNTEGERYKKIAKISNNYKPPSDACNSYQYLYELLSKFEERLHLHIHTENNILFPKIKKIFTN